MTQTISQMWLPRSGLLTKKGRTSYSVTAIDLSNLEFEFGTSGWVAGSNTNITSDNTKAFQGDKSCKLTSISSGTISMSQAGWPVVVGTDYTFSIYVATLGTPRSNGVSIDWINSVGGVISTTTGTASNSSTTFSQRTVNGVAPSLAVTATVRLTITGVGATAVHFADSASFGITPGGGPPSTITLLDKSLTSYTVLSPISNANMWDLVGGNVGNQGTFARTSVVDLGATHGKVLNQHFTAGLAKTSDGIAMAVPLTQVSDEATIEYDLRVNGSAGYVSTSNTGVWGGGFKIPGLGGVLPGAGISPPTGGNPDARGWTCRFMDRSQQYNPGKNAILALGGVGQENVICGYMYDPTQPAGNYGQDRFPTMGNNGELIRNTWHTLKQYHKMNTINVEGVSGNADGIHRIWFDGVLVFEKLNQVYRIYEDARITHLMWSNFYGGADNTWAPSVNVDQQIDNLKVVITPLA